MLIGFACSWEARVRLSVSELISRFARIGQLWQAAWRHENPRSERKMRRERLVREMEAKIPMTRRYGERRREGTEEEGRDTTSLGRRVGLWDVNCKCSGEPDNRIISQTVPSLLPVAPRHFQYSAILETLANWFGMSYCRKKSRRRLSESSLLLFWQCVKYCFVFVLNNRWKQRLFASLYLISVMIHYE